MAGMTVRPERVDPELDIIRKRGFQHEQRFLDELRAEGKTVAHIELDGSIEDRGDQLRAAAAATREAIAEGPDVIYQATFFDGTWRGHADFLLRVESGPTARFGPCHYEVADTKLARHVKASARAADLHVRRAAHRDPGRRTRVDARGAGRQRARRRAASRRRLHGVLPRGESSVRGRARRSTALAFPVAGHVPRARRALRRLPLGDECGQRRREDDHLSLVAGISRTAAAGAHGPWGGDARGPRPAAAARDPRIGAPATERWSASASRPGSRSKGRIGDAPRTSCCCRHRASDRPGRGLAAPRAVEGRPLLRPRRRSLRGDDGLEYLFGYVARRRRHATGRRRLGFTTAASEKRAFERFVDLVMERSKSDPAHAHLPLRALRADRAQAADGPLRARARTRSTACCAAAFRRPATSRRAPGRARARRELLDQEAGAVLLPRARGRRSPTPQRSSIGATGCWLETRGPRTILERDRRATTATTASPPSACATGWRRFAPSSTAQGGDVPRPAAADGEAPEEVASGSARSRRSQAAHRRRAGGPGRAHARAASALAAGAHTRLASPRGKSCGGSSTGWPTARGGSDGRARRAGGADASWSRSAAAKRAPIHRYAFPPQEHEVVRRREGAKTLRDSARRKAGKVVAIDHARTAPSTSRSGRTTGAAHAARSSRTTSSATEPIADALLRSAPTSPTHGLDGRGRYHAARDLLRRRPPRTRHRRRTAASARRDHRRSGARARARASRAACSRSRARPAPARRTPAARMIFALVRAGKTVGITANSPQGDRNLLDAVVEAARGRGVDVRVVQHGEPTRQDDRAIRIEVANDEVEARLAARARDVVGGHRLALGARGHGRKRSTCCSSTRPAQMSLANVLVVSQALRRRSCCSAIRSSSSSRSQGTHPDGADVSALEHLLGEHDDDPAGPRPVPRDDVAAAPEICDVHLRAVLRGPTASAEARRAASGDRLGEPGRRHRPALSCPSPHDAATRTRPIEEAEPWPARARDRALVGRDWIDRDGTERAARPATTS